MYWTDPVDQATRALTRSRIRLKHGLPDPYDPDHMTGSRLVGACLKLTPPPLGTSWVSTAFPFWRLLMNLKVIRQVP